MSVILCTAGYDHTIRFWEALSGFCSRQIPYSDSQINRLCISPNKAFVAAAGGQHVKLYSCKGNDPSPVLTFEGHTGNITGIGFHCDAKWMVTSSEDGTVKIWDTKSATVQRNYGHGCPVNDVVIHPNQGELISCDRNGSIRIWDLAENKCSHQLFPEDDVSIASITIASDGSMFCAGNNSGNVYVWRLTQINGVTKPEPVTAFTAHNTYITRVLLSPDVRHLATCSADHTARIWTVTLPDETADSDHGHAETIASADAVPEAGHRKIRDADEDDEDLDDDENDDDEDDDDEDSSSSISAGSSPPLSPGATFAHSPRPNRGRLSTQQQHSSQQARVPQTQPPRPQRQDTQELPLRPLQTATANTHLDTLTSTALQHTHAAHPTTGEPARPQPPPDPNTVGTTLGMPPSATPNAANMFMSMRPLHNKQQLYSKDAFPLETTLFGHQRWVWDCAFSADSAYLVTACSDHYARLWELSSKQVIRQYNGHHRGLVCVALNDYSN